MKHLFWLVEGALAGRPGPNVATWEPQELYDGGIRAVLTLNRGYGVDVDSLEAVGIAHKRIPILVQEPPQSDALEVAWPALEETSCWVWEQIQSGNPVLVHCTHGKDRTGLLLAYLLVRYYGQTSQDAIAHVRHVRPIALTAVGWEQFANDLLARCEVGSTVGGKQELFLSQPTLADTAK
ncbi:MULTISPECIES: dual specificity protein phosphatase family protein [unclassified Halomonas]|uniref:phosphatase domain-containing protein n=1 Tax=unclassified Halomonas TaxID=2609666 RepID=UPI001BE534F8|nr:dual specificity protein phosphatase family protein [Halomonas sp. ISL-106]MBT2798606.1 dual specificity protein phosphatase family protein [Halomonas sp. ISL-104]